MKKIVVVDIDGTIADCSERAEKYLSYKKDWDKFYENCDKDKPIEEIIELVNVLSQHYAILFCTGRRQSTKEKTIKWIRKNTLLLSYDIVFRKDGDIRHDTVVKPKLLGDFLKQNPELEVFLILEDRNSMVDKWRELGYRCLQVAPGNFQVVYEMAC